MAHRICVLLTAEESISKLVFGSPDNQHLRVDGSGGYHGDCEVTGSRDPTPAPESIPESSVQLALRFGQLPKNPSAGWVFGRNSECDVKLSQGDTATTQAISRKHFSLNLDQQGRFFLTDQSMFGTAVSYDGLHLEECRRQWRWFVPGTDRLPYKISIKLKNDMRFRVEVPFPDARRMELYKEWQSKLPPLDLLGLNSGTSTAQPSRPVTPPPRARSDLYLPLQLIGSGAFGDIHKVVRLRDGTTLASKTIRASLTGEQSKRKRGESTSQLEREVQLMREARHGNVMPVIDVVKTPQMTLYMPFFKAGSMQDHSDELREDQIVCIARQMLLAVDFLHSKGIIHRDLKPENVLLDLAQNKIRAVIGDFGLSKLLGATSHTVTICGTSLYLAPEVLRGPYGEKVDEYAAGMVLYEFIYGRKGEDNIEVGWLKERQIRIADLDDDQVNGIIQGLTHKRPEKRLSAKESLDRGCDNKLWKRVHGAVVDTSEVDATGLVFSSLPSSAQSSNRLSWAREQNKQVIKEAAPTLTSSAAEGPRDFWSLVRRATLGQPDGGPSLPDTDSSGSIQSVLEGH